MSHSSTQKISSASALSPNSEVVLITLEGDYHETGQFGRRILEVSATNIRVIDSDGLTTFQAQISDVRSARNEPLVGGGRLEITTIRGEILPVLTYSMTVAAKFSEAARGIEQLSTGEELNINLKQERVRCDRCNRLLPERDGVYLNESLSGIRVVKAVGQEDYENAKFLRRKEELCEAGVRADTRWFTIFGLMTFFASLGSIVNWFVGGTMVYRGQLSLGEFWKIHQLLGLIYGPMQWFAQVNNWFSRAMAGADRIFEIMDMEKENYVVSAEQHDISGRVEFCGVRF